MILNKKPRLFRSIIAIILLLGFLLNARYSQAAVDLLPATNGIDGPWQLIDISNSPSARYTHGMAYDSRRDRMVMFGGSNKTNSHLGDTWEFAGGDWLQIIPANSPPGRVNISQAMVYDSQRGKTVLFGGKPDSDRLDDTWEYDGINWVKIPISYPPPARDGHSLVYDDTRHLTVMFGGYNHTNPFMNDTWEYDGSDWTEVQPLQSPPGRNHHSIAYDSRRGVIVLFGGIEQSGFYLNDTWEYDGSTWQQVSTPDRPPARKDHSMAYDTSRGVVVLFGGTTDGTNPNGDTWEYDGINWYQVDTTLKPQARWGFPLVYDSSRQRIILFGGGYLKNGKVLTTYEDTWSFSGGGEYIIPYRVFLPLVE